MTTAFVEHRRKIYQNIRGKNYFAKTNGQDGSVEVFEPHRVIEWLLGVILLPLLPLIIIRILLSKTTIEWFISDQEGLFESAKCTYKIGAKQRPTKFRIEVRGRDDLTNWAIVAESPDKVRIIKLKGSGQRYAAVHEFKAIEVVITSWQPTLEDIVTLMAPYGSATYTVSS